MSAVDVLRHAAYADKSVRDAWEATASKRMGDVEAVVDIAAKRIGAFQSPDLTGHVTRDELRSEIRHIANAIIALNKRTVDMGKDFGEANSAVMKYAADVMDNLSGQICGVDDKVDAAIKAAAAESSLFRAAVASIEAETTRISGAVSGASRNAKVAVDLLESMNSELRETSARSVTLRTDLDQIVSDTAKAYQDLESDLSAIVMAVQSHGDRLDGIDLGLASTSSRADDALSSAARSATHLAEISQRLDDTDGTVDEIDDSLTKIEETTLPAIEEQLSNLRGRHNDLMGATLEDFSAISRRVDGVEQQSGVSELRDLILSSSQEQARETNRVATELGKAIDQMAARLAKISKARTRIVQRPTPKLIEAAAQ